MTITAKFASTCPDCGVRITPGERVEWFRGSKARHVACAARTAAPAVDTVADAERLAAAARAERERIEADIARRAANERELAAERARRAAAVAERAERDRRAAELAARAPVATYEAAEFAALGFPRVEARRAVTAIPVPVIPEAVTVANVVAGAAAEGHGALVGWFGEGKLCRAEITAAVAEAGLPAERAPRAKSAISHLGAVVGALNTAGYVVRRARSSAVALGAARRTWSARWAIFRVDAAGTEVGDAAGRTVLTVELDRDTDALRFEGDASLATLIRERFDALREGEIYEAGDVTAWLAHCLKATTGAVRFGIGYYVPHAGRDVAGRIANAVSKRWGTGWICPLLPVATGTELKVGIARGLSEEVATVARALETAREAAREAKPPKSEIGQARAATLLRDLEAVQDRIAAYRLLCGVETIRPIVAEIAALVTVLTPLTNDASVRFALLDLPTVEEIAVAPVVEGPTLAERAADAAAARRREVEAERGFDVAAEITRGAAPAIATGAVVAAVATRRAPTEPPVERTDADERFSLLELD